MHPANPGLAGATGAIPGWRKSRAPDHAACGAVSFVSLPCASPSPAQVITTLSEGAQKTSSPDSCGQASGSPSFPLQANSARFGAMEPHSSPWHLALPTTPEKPIALHSTAGDPELKPVEHTGDQDPCTSTSGLPWPSIAGEPSWAISLTCPCDSPWMLPLLLVVIRTLMVVTLVLVQLTQHTDLQFLSQTPLVLLQSLIIRTLVLLRMGLLLQLDKTPTQVPVTILTQIKAGLYRTRHPDYPL